MQTVPMLILGICGQFLIQNQDVVLCFEQDNVWQWVNFWGQLFITTNIFFATGYCMNTVFIFYLMPAKQDFFTNPSQISQEREEKTQRSEMKDGVYSPLLEENST